jgi:hypothetical protein
VELNKDTKFILGRPNFMCAPIAVVLRKAGHDIPKKAEDEQAHAIHWMLEMHEKHGSLWQEKANEFLRNADKRNNN